MVWLICLTVYSTPYGLFNAEIYFICNVLITIFFLSLFNLRLFVSSFVYFFNDVQYFFFFPFFPNDQNEMAHYLFEDIRGSNIQA